MRKTIIDRINSRPSVFISLGDRADEWIGKTYHTGSIDEAVNSVLRAQGKKRTRKATRARESGSRSTETDPGFFCRGKPVLPGDWGNVNACVDTGAEEYVRGRPHPMIDPQARNALLLKESARPDVAVLLFDVVLGYGSAMNPLEGLAGLAKGPILVTSICCTEEDKQGYDKIRKELDSLEVNVMASAGQAAWYAAQVMKGLEH